MYEYYHLRFKFSGTRYMLRGFALHRVSKSDLILPNLVPFSIAIKIQVAIEDDMCSGGMNMLQAVHLRFKFSGARYIQHMHRVSKSDHSSKHHVILDRYQDSGSD
jgi:hypothetical protein